ncbi:hypothetical protein BH23ACT7_BH23ACT7_07760 [soil metagenome]
MLAGGGSLGRRIAADLCALGDEVVVLSRRRRPDHGHRHVVWHGVTVGG